MWLIHVRTEYTIFTLLPFQHLLESRFLPGAIHKRSKFANFCYDLM